MSTVWKGDLVLHREPTSALWLRLGGRILRASLSVAIAWFAPWTWLRVVGIVLAVAFALLAIATLINWVRLNGVLLVLRGTGSIERPRSIQEIILRRPVEQVVGADVVVESELVVVPGRAGARVRLTAGDTSIVHIPLYGDEPEPWVERTNELLVGRETRLRYVPPPSTDDAPSTDDPQIEAPEE